MLTHKPLAFYHKDGMVPAWNQALKYAGVTGSIATMPDIAEARCKTTAEEFPWNTYFTTASAEYMGQSKQGNLILIIAHGVGPMATLAGIQATYSWQYNDKQGNRRGGRISNHEFHKLESGKYGEVKIIDLKEYNGRYKYAFMQQLLVSEALSDPVLNARLGKFAREYILAHEKIAKAWQESEGIKNENPYITAVEDAGNCSYSGFIEGYRKLEEGMSLGHLVSSGRLMPTYHDRSKSLLLDCGLHEWWNGTRIVGVPLGSEMKLLTGAPDVRNLIHQHWQELMIPTGTNPEIGFRALVKIGNTWFTQYQKQGARMDTCEPEFVVKSIEKIGKHVPFSTPIGGHEVFFKYDIKEVQAHAPVGANAYTIATEVAVVRKNGNPENHLCMVQFYRVEVDSTRRLRRADEIAYDYDTLMRYA